MPHKKKPVDIDAFVKKHLRRASVQWPERSIAMNAAKVAPGRWKCAECGKICKNVRDPKGTKKKDKLQKEYHVDHKNPVVPLDGKIMREGDRSRVDMNVYVDRLFVRATLLQILCFQCHQSKSAVENNYRAIQKQK